MLLQFRIKGSGFGIHGSGVRSRGSATDLDRGLAVTVIGRKGLVFRVSGSG